MADSHFSDDPNAVPSDDGVEGNVGEDFGEVVDQEMTDPGGQLVVDTTPEGTDGNAATAISRPLGDLAKAFALQAEILRGVHENQVRLQAMFTDESRSEMMINSTKALNETFRGVKAVQQGLASRLDEAERVSNRWKILTLLSVVLLFAGVFWGIHEVQGRNDNDSGALRRELADLRNGIFPRYDAMLSDAKENRERSDSLLAERDNLVATMKEDARMALKAQEELRKSLAQVSTARDQGGENLTRLQAKIDGLEEQANFYLQKSQAAEGEIRRLNEKVIARLEDPSFWERRDPNDGRDRAVVSAASSESRDAGRPAAAVGKTVVENVRKTTPGSPVARRVNKLLSNHRSSHSYQVDSLGGVGDHVLRDVVFTETAPGKGVVKRVTAEQLSFAISPRGDMVEINFLKGFVERADPGGTLGRRTPFYKDHYRMTVYCLNGSDWRSSSSRDGFISIQ